MSKPIYTLHLDPDYEYANSEVYKEAINEEVKALMVDSFDAALRMTQILRDDPEVTLLTLLYGEEEERKKALEAVEKAFRQEAEENVLSDWTEVPLTEADFVLIFRELGADTVNALVAEAFG